MERPFAGQVAIVTGASSGLGKDIAIMYASQGADVVVAARRVDALHSLVEELSAAYGGKHLALPLDLTREETIASLFADTIDSYGKFDILVNNAGDAYLWPLDKHTSQQVTQFMGILQGNVLMHLHGTQYLKDLLAQNKVQSPVIIDILSSAGQDIYPSNGLYGASKFFMRALSAGGAMDNPDITYVRLYPSNIDTPFINGDKASPDVWNFIKDASKLSPKGIAQVVGELTKERKGADVYMAQKEHGVYVGRFQHNPPHYQEDKRLEEIARTSK